MVGAYQQIIEPIVAQCIHPAGVRSRENSILAIIASNNLNLSHDADLHKSESGCVPLDVVGHECRDEVVGVIVALLHADRRVYSGH